MDKQTTFLETPTKPTHGPSTTHSLAVFVDGASRGNPGPAGAGIHVILNTKPVFSQGLFLGKKTNNQAEYLALLLALMFIHELMAEEKLPRTTLHVFSDSELMIKQMKGVYSVKNEQLKALKSFIDSLIKKHPTRFSHVRREKNTDADALANLGVDQQKKIPTRFQKILADYGLHV